MAKMIFFILSSIFIYSCRSDPNNKTYSDFIADDFNLVFGELYLNAEYNLRSDSLKARHTADVFYKDTMSLSQMEKETIAAFFYKNKIYNNPIYENTEWINIMGRNFTSPNFDDVIRIYRQNKLIVTINVNKDYESEGLFPNKEEMEVVEFRDVVWNILRKQNKYRTVMDSLKAKNRQNPVLFM
ncbi:hypothetical protein [Dyadobacter diqingensis]|uniref:hypothetical protein n=1 Tax=Dyadobacter diqingensis TaxID=2938121 RepID=UPI0020C1A60F|nr:hypothetical protein [Dyadobacter diqingensis]